LVFSKNNVLTNLISNAILHNRVGKWALAFCEFSLHFETLRFLKGQVAANLLDNDSFDNLIFVLSKLKSGSYIFMVWPLQ